MIFLRLPLLFLLAATLAHASPAFEYGPRPAAPLFDPENFLTPDQASKIIKPLQEVMKNDNIDVIAVVLPTLGDAPPKYVAERFGEAWGDATVHAVVLFSPGRQDGPWIVPGGKFLRAIKPAEVEKKIAVAQRRAASEPYASHKILAACTEASDLLRYWTGGMLSYGENFQFQRSVLIQEQQRKKFLLKAIGLGTACSVIPAALFIWWIVRRRRAAQPLHFPIPPITPRLGAPYAGGNHVTLDLEVPSNSR
ncbi:MAG: TPM domain-containing protein [Luteolibacter sp.]